MKTIKSPSSYRSAFPTQAVLVVAAVCLAGLCPTAFGTSGIKKPDPQTPNILWLIAEDFGQHLGCYGTKEVWTPNLDRLAAEGVRYDRFYNGHVCSPSRSAFNTGMYATTIGAHNHRTSNKQPLPDGNCPRHAISRAPARPTGTSSTKASHSIQPIGMT
jgi:uncharacterized sulfatase